jgi:hypothetical protein
MCKMAKVVMNLIRNWGRPRLIVWLLGLPLRWGPRWQKKKKEKKTSKLYKQTIELGNGEVISSN